MSLRDKILQMLRGQNDSVSGERIRRALKVSRTAVWKQIEVLRREGYQIESSPKRGYRMVEEPDRLSESEILSAGALEGEFLRIKILEETDSTNQNALELGLKDAPEGTVILAEKQRAGRGRLGRIWESPSHRNLYLSVILRPNLPPSSVSPITLVAGIACHQALSRFIKTGLRLKWPNDLWVDSRKIGGILTEMEAEQDKVHLVVVGIGLNINSRPEDFSPELRPLATSIAIETQKKHSRSQVAGLLLSSLFQHYRTFLKEGFDGMRRKWEELSRMRGAKVKVDEGDRAFEGVCEGLDENGFLLVKTPSRLERVVAGDVSWI
jgi:BirA family transcriptional regulator, biotin operon repressor / biotin---[acetyl-CoA-carboxylase] ligase